MNTLFKLALLSSATAILALSCTSDTPLAKANLSYVRAQLPKEPRRLFPLLSASSYETQVNDLIYQYLLHFDPVTEELAPQLAEELPNIQTFIQGEFTGQTGYTFRLREGAQWSDGQPVTVSDVIFTFKAIWFPEFASSPLQGGIRELTDVVADSSDERSFTVIASTANLNGAAYYGNIPILPEHVYDADLTLRSVALPTLIAATSLSELPQQVQGFASDERMAPFGKTTVVGSGPYLLDEWLPGQALRLVRNPNFWGKDLKEGLFLAKPDTLEYIPVPDANAALAMLRNGDLDVLANIQAKEALELQAEGDVYIYKPLQLTRTLLYLNTKDAKLADADTRKGLAHLLNVAGFLKDVQLGYGKALDGPYHPDQAYAKTSQFPVRFNIDSAKFYFERAGWQDTDSDGILDRARGSTRESLSLAYLYPSASQSSEALALLYASDAKRAGVEITPIGKEFGAMLADLGERKFQIVQGALGSEPLPDDPYGMWHTDSDSPQGKNRSGFGTAATDALIDSIRVNLEPKSRAKQYTRLAQAIAAQQPVIFLIVPQERIAVRKGLKPLITSRRPGYYLPGFSVSEK